MSMKLTAKIKLNPTDEQHQLLHETLQTANAACNYISDVAWEQKVFNTYKLHHLCYYDVRERFGLTAQVAVRALGKVADGYKLDKKQKRQFKEHGAFPFDSRILKYRLDTQQVSIWTVDGRKTIPFQAGNRQLELLHHQKGESDLAFVRGEFYLFATCEIDEPTEDDVADCMGVDLGIANIATTDDGERSSGTHTSKVRHRNRALRQKLQKRGTKSARRRLKKLSGKEARFANDVNHCISKAIVEKAKRYTSQTCSSCGHVSKSNRQSQSVFLCTSCGYSAHADVNGAANIGVRGTAAVTPPYVSDADCAGAAKLPSVGHRPTPLASAAPGTISRL